MSPKDEITMTFTRHEWRLLAVAAARVYKGSYIASLDVVEVRKLARVIVAETGKEPK